MSDKIPTVMPVHKLENYVDLCHYMELMHDRCITRNLQAAGLGGYDPEQELMVYGDLDANALLGPDSLLMACLKMVADNVRQVINYFFSRI